MNFHQKSIQKIWFLIDFWTIFKILAKKCFPLNGKKSTFQTKITKYGPQGPAAFQAEGLRARPKGPTASGPRGLSGRGPKGPA